MMPKKSPGGGDAPRAPHGGAQTPVHRDHTRQAAVHRGVQEFAIKAAILRYCEGARRTMVAAGLSPYLVAARPSPEQNRTNQAVGESEGLA